MAEERKPLKRSEELAPLSREHHEGLLFCWKIKQGISFGTEASILGKYVNWFWNNYLKHHFIAEEKAFNDRFFLNDAMVERMKDEHQNIEALIHINESIADVSLISQLTEELNNHIRFEERELFPYIEKKLSNDELKSISVILSSQKKSTEIWTNEFWIKK